MNTVVLGLGNSILGDDAVGLRVAAEVEKKLRRSEAVVLRTELGGLNLLELLAGYDRAIILDAIHKADGKPGQICRLTEASCQSSHHISSGHRLHLKDIVELGKRFGLAMPRELVILGIVVEDAFSFGERLTPAVERAVSICAEKAVQELQVSVVAAVSANPRQEFARKDVDNS